MPTTIIATDTYKLDQAQRVSDMTDGELIVFNNGTFLHTPARELALEEIRQRGLSRNGFYTPEAQQAAREYVRPRS